MNVARKSRINAKIEAICQVWFFNKGAKDLELSELIKMLTIAMTEEL